MQKSHFWRNQISGFPFLVKFLYFCKIFRYNPINRTNRYFVNEIKKVLFILITKRSKNPKRVMKRYLC